MARMKSLRPSPAMAVALLALFVAMGGVGYAAATIGSAQIKNNSIRSKDIRNGQVTGRDVKESALGKVRSAARADSATRAGSAASADRATTAGNVGGLTADQLRLRCPAGTEKHFGVCVELAARGPANHVDAAAACDARGGNLPSWVQLNRIRELPGITWADGDAGQYELTGDVADSLARTVYAINKGGAGLGNGNQAAAANQALYYRCLIEPVNG
jgi:hypothetical protein